MTTTKKSRPKTSLRQRALNLLARREYSRVELARRLNRYREDETDAEIEVLLDDIEGRGWLSDRRFAEQVVNSRARQYGSRRIAHELREKGVAGEVIEAALSAKPADDLESARELWRRKFGSPPSEPKEKARQVRFLQSRGYGLDVIFKVIGGSPDEAVDDGFVE